MNPGNDDKGNQSCSSTSTTITSTTTTSTTTTQNTILWWPSEVEYIPFSQEEAMVRIMFERNGKKERGMMKDKPPFLLRKFKAAMRSHAPSMNLPQLLSLRRHHIKLLNPSRSTMAQLGLGRVDDINESARIFEGAVGTFLRKSCIKFCTEKEQVEQAKTENRPLFATPDFLLPEPVTLRIPSRKSNNDVVFEEFTIRWVEAKMYYGASTIPGGSSGAVGTVLPTARKYVDSYGPGALIFMMGCGDRLASDLAGIGVVVLDCNGTVSLKDVHAHQRTWCGNEKGHILP
jgi:hypothetical protein